MPKIVIPVEIASGLDSTLAQHFGRAPYFAIVDLNKNDDIIIIQNQNEHMGGTAHPHESILDLHPDIIIAYTMGPGALSSFKNAGTMVLKAEGATVKEVIANFKADKLEDLVGGCQHAHEHHH